jgi:hypothetical protein
MNDTNFQSKFDPARLEHRAQMFQILIALAREILNGPSGMKFKQNFFQHAKRLGWIPENIRTKRVGLEYLVNLAVQGFGYVPKGTVKEALAPKKTIKKKKVA